MISQVRRDVEDACRSLFHAMKKILLTRSGYGKLLRELAILNHWERPRVVREILESAADRGWEADADFQSTLARQQKVERRIRQVQEILANAEVLMGGNLLPDRVRFGSRVRLLNLLTGKEHQFKLVGPVEADASQGNLSIASPLGQALLGRGPGERVELKTPGGLRTYQIMEIFLDEP
ncbi:MAG: transcription elongation factor GreA [Deltaproteobacteria bacterium]|nr:transcription elongation factor GreA [Deltaproteobacteria bacterium]